MFYGKITTTKAKAKAIQGDVDKVISLAKEGSLSAQRRILSELANDRDSLEILFNKVAPAFKERTSGFTRIIMLPRRKGDNAEMVRIEWSQEIIDKKSKVKKAKAKEKKVKAKPKKK